MDNKNLKDLGVLDAIDTHLHPWRFSDLPPVIQAAREVRPDLYNDFSPSKVIDTAAASGCTQVIFVQARDPHEDSRSEAEFFITAAQEHPQGVGCVVGIDLLDPSGTERFLTTLPDNKVVRACRMIAPENVGFGILSDSRTKATAKIIGDLNLRLDLLVRSANPGQLSEAVGLVQWLAAHTNTVVIGDHLLKPTGVAEGIPSSDWLKALSELARCENFYMKLSGLPGEVPQGSSAERFWPFYDAALSALGSQRLLFGSDHPVSYNHSASVASVAAWITERGLNKSSAAQDIFASTAREAYAI